MKAWVNVTIGLAALAMAASSSCKKDDKTDRYSFWTGDIENSYYVLDMNGERRHLVIGKPFMVVEYEPLDGVPIKCAFGLSDARNEYLDGMEGAIPEPFMQADILEYADRLDLSGSVSLLCDWETVQSHEELSAGGFEFWVDKGKDMWGHEVLHFSYTFDDMSGEINNPDATWGGRVSEEKAFLLIKRSTSNKL